MQLSLFKKPKRKEFCEMTKPEKKNFLANDLIERMIHVEQRVRGSMGEGVIPYYHTNYFKELRNEEKKKFVSYLKSKEVKRKWKFLPWVIIIGFGIFSGFRLTGNAIAGQSNVSILDISLVSAIILIAVFYAFHVANEKKRWKKMEGHFDVIEGVLRKRRLNKK